MNNDINKYDLIKSKLKNKERSFSWFARKVGCNESNLKKTLINSRFLYPDLIKKMSDALDEDLFTVLFPQYNKELEKN